MKLLKPLSIMSFVIAYLITSSVFASQIDTNNDGIVSELEVKRYIDMRLTLTSKQEDSSTDIDQLLPEVYD